MKLILLILLMVQFFAGAPAHVTGPSEHSPVEMSELVEQAECKCEVDVAFPFISNSLRRLDASFQLFYNPFVTRFDLSPPTPPPRLS